MHIASEKKNNLQLNQFSLAKKLISHPNRGWTFQIVSDGLLNTVSKKNY